MIEKEIISQFNEIGFQLEEKPTGDQYITGYETFLINDQFWIDFNEDFSWLRLTIVNIIDILEFEKDKNPKYLIDDMSKIFDLAETIQIIKLQKQITKILNKQFTNTHFKLY